MIKKYRLNITAIVLVITLSTFLHSCYVGPGSPIFSSESNDIPAYKLYPGNTLEDHEIVKVRLKDAYYAVIDGSQINRSDYEVVHMLPGAHKIQWGKVFAISVLVDPAMWREGDGSAVVDLKAGHEYDLYADRTTGHGYSMYFWIQDAESGEVVAGTKKP